MRGVKKEVVTFSVYLPPEIQSKLLNDILETLTDAISEAIAKANDPWILVGGDFNRYNTSVISQTVPQLSKVDSEPTRRDATLDYTFTNFGQLIDKVQTCYPIESDHNKSDHMSVAYNAILTRPASFAWETSEYLKITSEGRADFRELSRSGSLD